MPTEVNDDETTVALSVVPVSVPAGATTVAVLTAVTSPLAFTVGIGIVDAPPKLPTLLFTVASVKARLLDELGAVASPDAV